MRHRVRDRLRALALTLLVCALLTVAAPPANAAVTLTQGHVDVLDVDYTGGALVVRVLDDTVSPAVLRNPADVVFQVPAAAKTTVPSGSQWAFLGAPGSTVWVLPQSQVAGLLWAGWNTAGVPSGVFSGNLTFSLTGVTGPGNVSIYTTSLGTPTVRANSGNGLPDQISVPRNTHTHANWAFTAAGTYAVTFNVSGTLLGGGTVSSGSRTFTFQALP